MHILSLQPWYGGSHRAFQTGWQRYSEHEWTILSLPPRHWKWRMRHAAVEFARRLASDFPAAAFDAILCSDFLNVAEFRGLVSEPLRQLPSVVYFHENQFEYPVRNNPVRNNPVRNNPVRNNNERDMHFAFTNFTSCLAADQIWFNSKYNRDSFFCGLRDACRRWPDYAPLESVESLTAKCHVESPGIEIPFSPEQPDVKSEPPDHSTRCLNLVWAARWEHDKNPALLVEALRALRQREIAFRVSIIGETFRNVPGEFRQIRNEFDSVIDRWGFLESRDEYWQTLAEADVFLSTADHEFFGIAAAEAIIAGAIPVLPDRLAYPELVRIGNDATRRARFLYDGSTSDLITKIEYISTHKGTYTLEQQRRQLQTELVAALDWRHQAGRLDGKIADLAALAATNGQ